ncbi:MAG: HD domain-containing protein [Deltaproteobacteria bacterium]|nr:HD domain-containing protein [Deltaproteobacteria bacterium]
MKDIAEFLFTAAMLRRTPRSGLQFLGSGKESVAEHVFQTMIAAYALVKMEHEKGSEVDEKKVLRLSLLHDMLESRTGDHNYVNKKYIKVDETKALNDMCRPLFFGDEIKEMVTEFENKESLEAQLAADADQLALIVLVKEQHDLGNPYASKWLTVARQRLLTESGRNLARALNDSDWAAWWFSKESNEWWVNGKTEGELDR